jgi:AraC-like DNA-binding protein
MDIYEKNTNVGFFKIGGVMKKMLYLEEHISCSEYSPNILVGFKHRILNEESFLKEQDKDYHHLIFFLEGDAIFSCNELRNKFIRANEFILIPKSSDFSCRILSTSSVVIFTFDRFQGACNKLELQSLAPLSSKIQYDFEPTVIYPPLKTFLNTMIEYMECRMNCKHLHEIKSMELFLLFRGFYTKEELAYLFHPIIGKSLDFRSLMFENYLKVDHVDELAKIAGMGRTNFNNKFREEFGISPHQWLLKQKAKHVRFKLAEPGNTLSDIMRLYKFNSATHFTRFCKQQFGCTPSELLRQLKAEK